MLVTTDFGACHCMQPGFPQNASLFHAPLANALCPRHLADRAGHPFPTYTKLKVLHLLLHGLFFPSKSPSCFGYVFVITGLIFSVQKYFFWGSAQCWAQLGRGPVRAG